MTNNEIKKLSRNRKRRIERKNKMDKNIKVLLNKIKTEKKKKNLDKIKQLEILLTKINYANDPNKLQSALKELSKIQGIKKNYLKLKMRYYKIILVHLKWSVI